MSDTSFSKPSHTNGPIIKIYDLSGTGGPYAEAAAILGWDPVGLSWVKVKVDSSGQIFTVGGTSTGGGGGVTQVIGSDGTATNVGFSGSNLTMPVSGTVAVTGGGTTTLAAGTATIGTSVVVGTITNIPSGTQVVSGTVGITGTATLVGTETSGIQVWGAGTAGTWTNVGFGTTGGTANLSVPVQVQAGTVSVIQVTSPWVIGGTTTTAPTGTQAVSQTGAPWSVSVTTQTTAGCSVYNSLAVNATGTVIKSSAGVLYGYDIWTAPSGTVASFVKLYNKATAPTGTDTPIMVLGFGIPAAITTQVNPGDRALHLNPPIVFSSGIGIRASALAVGTDTTAPNTIVANIFFA